MGMSTHIVGIVPKDEKYEKMLAIYKMCEDSGVQIPQEVDEFFGDNGKPEKKGMVVDLPEECYEECSPHRSACGYDLDLRKIPTHIKIIRFYNSW